MRGFQTGRRWRRGSKRRPGALFLCLAGLALSLPAPALAATGPPIVSMYPPKSGYGPDIIGPTTATIEGEAYSEGETRAWAEYGVWPSDWCLTGGVKGSHERTTPRPVAEQGFILAELSDLTEGTPYCVRLVAENAYGTGASEQMVFETEVRLQLTVSIAGTGSGTVTGFGISCPDMCSHTYTSQAGGRAIGNEVHVALTATPAAGDAFAGWALTVAPEREEFKGWSAGSCPPPFGFPFVPTPAECEVKAGGVWHVTATFSPPSTGQAIPASCRMTLASAHGATVLVISKRRAKKRGAIRGRLPIRLSCSQSASVNLTAIVGERPRRAGRHQRRTTYVVLPKLSTRVKMGSDNSLTLTVPSAVIRALRAGDRVSVRLTLVVSSAAGSSTLSRAVALRIV